MRSQPSTYPRIRKALVSAIGNTIDSLPSTVRQQLRGRWRWQIAPVLYDGRTVAHADANGVITFDPSFVEGLVDAGEVSALEALACHELGHIYRQLRGEAAPDRAAEEAATNKLMREWGFGHDLRRLKKLSGYLVRRLECLPT